MIASSLIATLALDGSLPDGYHTIEVLPMKVKTTFYSRKSGKDYDPVIHTKYPRSRADQLSYQPTSKLIDQMIRTGQLVLASKAQFDFPDGKDDGRDVPVDRLRGLDYPEVSQMMAENEDKLAKHRKNLSEISDKSKKKASSESKDTVASGTDEASVATQGSDAGGVSG